MAAIAMPFGLDMPQSLTVINYPSVGLSPSGFPRVHAEMLPREVAHMVGYDPRAIMIKVRKSGARPRKDTIPGNVAPEIVALHNQVQRSIDPDRVQRMVAYLLGAMERGEFANWGSIELATVDMPDTTRLKAEHLVTMTSDTDFFITDGQHRYCALLDFIRQYPAYAERFTQSVTISVLPEERLVEWAGQEFHDRNYFSVPVRAGKALAVDTRDPVNHLAKSLAEHPTVKEAGGIAYERDTLLTGDSRFTTHSVLHRFVKGFLFGRGGLDKGADTADIPVNGEANLAEYLHILGDIMPWGTHPEDGVASVEDRDAYVTRASVMFAALAVIGHDVYAKYPDVEARVKILRRLENVNWRRSNLALVGIVGTEKNGMVQPASSRQAIDGTIRWMREMLGLTVETAEATTTTP